MPVFKLDDHPIKRIAWEPSDVMPDQFNSVEVGRNGVTAIDVREHFCGEYTVVWFQVWKDDVCVARYNGRNVDSIIYFEDEDEDDD